jgi:hypothetical protein
MTNSNKSYFGISHEFYLNKKGFSINFFNGKFKNGIVSSFARILQFEQGYFFTFLNRAF